MAFAGIRPRPDHDIADNDLKVVHATRSRCIVRGNLDDQFGERRQASDSLGQHQVASAYPLAPVVDLPAGGAVLARDIGQPHPRHHALRRNPRPLGLRAPATPAGPSITSSRETPAPLEPSRWTPILPSLSKIQSLRHAHARRMAGSDQNWQKVIGVALTIAPLSPSLPGKSGAIRA